MRIAWFTPLVKQSAIGKVGVQICEELVKQYDVTIWTPHTDDLLSTSVPVFSFKPSFLAEELAGYDYIFYNMGNFAGYHREIFDAMQKVPGIVILHDQTMAEFFGQYYCIPEFGGDDVNGILEYQKFLIDIYGEHMQSLVEAALQKNVYPFYSYDDLHEYSLLEPIIKNSLGVFTHSATFSQRLTGLTNYPVDYAYLPCDLSKNMLDNGTNELLKTIQKAKAEERKIIVSTGIVHPVKRIDKVTEVLLMNPELAKKICYLVVGSYGGEYGEKLKQLADNELKGCLYMLGYQPEDVMYRALQIANLAINLRYPNSEVCSLSLLEQMSFAKPVLVLNSGIYSEMPDDAVLKIELSNERQGILQMLQQLVNGGVKGDVGQNAQKFVKEQCSVENYCRSLIAFAKKVEEEENVAVLQNRIIASLAGKMADLHITEDSVPASFAMITERLSSTFGAKNVLTQTKTVGIWIGFPYEIPNLSREGISRAMAYLVSSLLQYYEDVQIEVWCYSFNEEEVERIFATIPDQQQKRIKYITEQNWLNVFDVGKYQQIQIGNIDYVKDNLVDAVRLVSKVSVFIPLILYLDRITEANKKLVAPGYDMAVAEHYTDFISKDPLYIARNLDITWRAKNLAAHNAKFFCISKTVMNSEILKYVNNLPIQSAQTIYIPPDIPDYNEEKILPEEVLKKSFALRSQYLFYPTQIRPYKNITTLIKAFAILSADYPDLQLVLTGNPKEYPEVEKLIVDLQIAGQILLPKNVSELELYSLYHYAAVIPVTSTFEGGFPLQAMEALLMETPVVCSDIPIVHERIESFGFTPENCGFPIFEPLDYKALADILRDILADRSGAVKRQKAFREKLLGYTWQEAIPYYYKLLFEDEN